MVKESRLPWQMAKFDPGWGTKILHAVAKPKKKKKEDTGQLPEIKAVTRLCTSGWL